MTAYSTSYTELKKNIDNIYNTSITEAIFVAKLTCCREDGIPKSLADIECKIEKLDESSKVFSNDFVFICTENLNLKKKDLIKSYDDINILTTKKIIEFLATQDISKEWKELAKLSKILFEEVENKIFESFSKKHIFTYNFGEYYVFTKNIISLNIHAKSQLEELFNISK